MSGESAEARSLIAGAAVLGVTLDAVMAARFAARAPALAEAATCPTGSSNWPTVVTEAKTLATRGRVAGSIHRRKIRARPLVSPYVADEPDGPVVASTENFRQGRSWWADPGLTA